MFNAFETAVIAGALSASALTFTSVPAGAAPAEAVAAFRNCDHLHRTYAHGVARSDRAARRQVRSGHFRPAVRPRVYRANDDLDADNDGTACEVSR
jgi:Excalibur calcium-binding domain